MYYIIYKTTNLFNGKFYIGKHQTNDLNDGYVGSGKLLKRAIEKYGLDQFKTEIIEICPTEAHMNLAEKVYVVIDSEVSYNLCPGGRGGFGYINNNIDLVERNLLINSRKDYKSQGKKISLRYKEDQVHRDKVIKNLSKGRIVVQEMYPNGTFKGKKHSKETLEKMKNSRIGKQAGSKNSQFGRPRSEETKQKIRDSLARTRAKRNSSLSIGKDAELT